MSALDMAKELLSSAENDLKQFSKLSVSELTKSKGIGTAKAIIIVAAFELGRRTLSAKAKTKARITSSRDAYECINGMLTDLHHEEFKTIFLREGSK